MQNSNVYLWTLLWSRKEIVSSLVLDLQEMLNYISSLPFQFPNYLFTCVTKNFNFTLIGVAECTAFKNILVRALLSSLQFFMESISHSHGSFTIEVSSASHILMLSCTVSFLLFRCSRCADCLSCWINFYFQNDNNAKAP